MPSQQFLSSRYLFMHVSSLRCCTKESFPMLTLCFLQDPQAFRTAHALQIPGLQQKAAECAQLTPPRPQVHRVHLWWPCVHKHCDTLLCCVQQSLTSDYKLLPLTQLFCIRIWLRRGLCLRREHVQERDRQLCSVPWHCYFSPRYLLFQGYHFCKSSRVFQIYTYSQMLWLFHRLQVP